MFESCTETRLLFSGFLDGECSRSVYTSVQFHLRHCNACRLELDRAQMVQSELRQLPRRRVPEGVALRLRVLMSQELHRNWLSRVGIWLENALQPLLLPASGGLLSAILFFGLIMGSEVAHVTPVDLPEAMTMPPRVQVLAPLDFNTGDQPLVLMTHVNAQGRVLDYRVLSGPSSPELFARLDRMMYQSLFRPAIQSGKPTEGHVVLSLRRITVRG